MRITWYRFPKLSPIASAPLRTGRAALVFAVVKLVGVGNQDAFAS
jgi:hypothetical protein